METETNELRFKEGDIAFYYFAGNLNRIKIMKILPNMKAYKFLFIENLSSTRKSEGWTVKDYELHNTYEEYVKKKLESLKIAKEKIEEEIKGLEGRK